MAELLDLEVATPERLLVKEQVSEVQIPGKNGYLGVLPGHAALLAELATGFMYYVAGDRRWYLAIHGGFVEINNDHVRILADVAQRAEEIDVARARAELEQAQRDVMNPALGVDPAQALIETRRAQAWLDAAAHK
jgi:F-type H+-transporting ATPase subunit epsilon